jgi:hypothetical protein
MVNNVTGVVNYVIAAGSSLLNFMIADKAADPTTTIPTYQIPSTGHGPAHVPSITARCVKRPS